jgi:hypothetical protein
MKLKKNPYWSLKEKKSWIQCIKVQFMDTFHKKIKYPLLTNFTMISPPNIVFPYILHLEEPLIHLFDLQFFFDERIWIPYF